MPVLFFSSLFTTGMCVCVCVCVHMCSHMCMSVCVCVCVCLSPRGVFRFCKGECMRGLLSGGKESSQAVHMLKGPLFSSPLFCSSFIFLFPHPVFSSLSLSLSLSLPSSVHSCTNVPLGSTLSVKDYKGSMIGLGREVNDAIRQEFFTVCVWCVCVCVYARV